MSHAYGTQNNEPSDPLAVSAKKLAKLLDVSERHIWQMLKDGRLGPQPVALGNSRRWYLEDIRRWLAAGAPAREKWELMERGRLSRTTLNPLRIVPGTEAAG